MFKFFSRPLVITRLNITPPTPKAVRAPLAVAVTVRNEAAHLAEWLDFHRAVGVSAFFAYDDASTDETREILQARATSHGITILPWSQRVRYDPKRIAIDNQVLAYAHAVCNFGPNYRWMAFIDADEFLVPMAEDSLLPALNRLDSVANISLPWHMFGTSGHAAPPEGGTLANFTQRKAEPMRAGVKGVVNFKSLVDPCRVSRVKVHGVETDGKSETYNDQGQWSKMTARFGGGFYSNVNIQLNHYYTRSRSEFNTKINGRIVGLGTGTTAKHRAMAVARGTDIERGAIEDRRAYDLAIRLNV